MDMSDMESDHEVDISILRGQVECVRFRKRTKRTDPSLQNPNTTTLNRGDVENPNISISDDEFDNSDEDTNFSMDNCDLNSSDSDEISLAEIKRRRRKTRVSNLFDPLSVASTSTATTSMAAATTLIVEDHTPSTSTLPADESENNTQREIEQADESTDNDTGRARSRKRVRSEERWKKTVIKTMRNTGQSFTSETGKYVKAREMMPPCAASCPRKCTMAFKEEDRKLVFEQYWSTGSKQDQRHFICKSVEKASIQRETCGKETKRQVTFKYFFMKDNQKLQVCRTFFLNTLGVKKDFVHGTVNRQSEVGILQDAQSGRHGKQRKWSDDSIASVIDHIKTFPTVDSHYCRKESSRGFLDQVLSVSTMHKLYVEKCNREGIAPIVSKDKYQRIFCERFNLSFFRPKKDRCDECVAFENLSVPNEQDKCRHAQHLHNKDLARQLKREAKEKSLADQKYGAACFDMQQLLPCPKSNSSTFYYKRKLYVHNLTVYDLGTAEVRCFMWPEHEAGRGSNEVGTCLAKFIEEKAKQQCKQVSLFADNCPGQNRNRFIGLMLNETNKIVRMETISLTFLQKGHTETENDSVHSVIERATKHAILYTPEQWYAAVRTARKSKSPYVVEELNHKQFIDWKEMSKNVKNMTIEDSGDKVKWSKIKQFVVYAHDPQALYVTYEYYGAEVRIDLQRRQRGRASSRSVTPTHEPSNRIYIKYMSGIPRVKKEDILSLCQSALVPATYHSFYENLPLSSGVDEELNEED